MEKREIEGTAMYRKKDLKSERILASCWAQFMDNKMIGIRMALAWALLALPTLSAWAASDVTAAN